MREGKKNAKPAYMDQKSADQTNMDQKHTRRNTDQEEQDRERLEQLYQEASLGSYGPLIREFRRRNGLSQEQLGAMVRVKKNAVGAWEAGRSRPDLASVPVLCRELGIPLEAFFGMQRGEKPGLIERFERLNLQNRQAILREMDRLYALQRREPERVRRVIPLYQNELAASAGPVSYLQEAGGETVYLAENERTAKAHEVIRVSGDSMEPTFRDGDLVLVQHAASLREGEIGIFVNEDAGYIKEYHRDGLYSHNAKYAPIRFSGQDLVRCVGRVLGRVSKDEFATPEEIEEHLTHAGRNGKGACVLR